MTGLLANRGAGGNQNYSLHYHAVCCVQCDMRSMHCAVCSVPCVVCIVRSEMCSVQCVVFSVQCAVLSVQCAVCSVQCHAVCSAMQWYGRSSRAYQQAIDPWSHSSGPWVGRVYGSTTVWLYYCIALPLYDSVCMAIPLYGSGPVFGHVHSVYGCVHGVARP